MLTIGFGMVSEYSRNRVPSPPQKSTTFMIGLSPFPGECRRRGLRVHRRRPVAPAEGLVDPSGLDQVPELRRAVVAGLQVLVSDPHLLQGGVEVLRSEGRIPAWAERRERPIQLAEVDATAGLIGGRGGRHALDGRS